LRPGGLRCTNWQAKISGGVAVHIDSDPSCDLFTMTSLLRPRPRLPVCQCQRAFSISSSRTSLQWERNDPEAIADTVPAYPYGPTRWYKQSRHGLYGGQRIQFGNNVGEKIETKTRRTWHPNIFTRKLFSKALDRPVQVKVSTRVLRTIDKLGGLDEYLLGEKEARIKTLGESGWWLRWAIMQTPAVKSRFAEERKRLGIPEGQALQEEETVAEAPAVLEEATQAEFDALEVDGEALATDGTFEVEQTADLPLLKFRVDRGKHIVLTPSGWRRTRPSNMEASKASIAKLAADLKKTYVPMQMAEFEAELKDQQEAAVKRSERLGILYRAAAKAARTAQSARAWADSAVARAQERAKERAKTGAEGIQQVAAVDTDSVKPKRQYRVFGYAIRAEKISEEKRQEYEKFADKPFEYNPEHAVEPERERVLFERGAILSEKEIESVRSEAQIQYARDVRAKITESYENRLRLERERLTVVEAMEARRRRRRRLH